MATSKKQSTYKALTEFAPAGKKTKIKKGDEISQEEYAKLSDAEQGLFIQTNTVDGKTAAYQQKTEADKANAAGSMLTHDAVPDLAGGLKENLVPVRDAASGNIHFENVNAEGNEDLIAPDQQPTPNDIAVSAEPSTK
jgi:hypothetical protein